jgi:hypothetical protein
MAALWCSRIADEMSKLPLSIMGERVRVAVFDAADNTVLAWRSIERRIMGMDQSATNIALKIR